MKIRSLSIFLILYLLPSLALADIIVLKSDRAVDKQIIGHSNSTFVIEDEINISSNGVVGNMLIMPDNCVLDFRGGCLKNGSIKGNNTTLRGDVKIYNLSQPLTGTFNNKMLESDWFGFRKNGTNEDELWRLFIQSGLNTGCSLFLNKGEYCVYSMIAVDATPGFTLIGENNENTVIKSCGEEDTPLFYIVNAGHLGVRYAKIANLKLERQSCWRHTGTGIRLGNYEKSAIFGEGKTCSHITLENLDVSNFKIGLDYNRTWNNITNNIKVRGNYYGLKSCCTMVHINGAWIQNNVVGIYQPRYNWGGNLSVVNGNIEYNAIGIIVDSGNASFYDCFFENNKPTDLNLGESTEYAFRYPGGAECVAGKENEEVGSLSFVNCVSGRSVSNTSSLYDLDNIANLSIVGCNIENILSTPRTQYSIVSSPTTHWFNNAYKEYVRAYTSPSYALSDQPALFFDDFSKWSVLAAGKSYFSDGVLCSMEGKFGELTVRNKSFIRTLTKENDSFSFQISIPSRYFAENGNVTFRVRYRIGKRINILDISDNKGRKRIRREDNVYNDDCIHEIDINAKRTNGVFFTRFNVNGINKEEKDTREFYYEIVSVAVFDGYTVPSKKITKWNDFICSKDIVVAKKALTLPSKDTDTPYIKGNFIYFDNDENSLVIRDEMGLLHNIESVKKGINRCGSFSDKPKVSDIYIGFRYFCTDRQTPEGKSNGIDIVWNGEFWVDALGRVVKDGE